MMMMMLAIERWERVECKVLMTEMMMMTTVMKMLAAMPESTVAVSAAVVLHSLESFAMMD